jgi:hypothetical protein
MINKLLPFLFMLLLVLPSWGQEVPVTVSGTTQDSNLESLDPKIQSLKEEILELNSLLFRLQEDLLFPEDSSLVVFLSVEGGNYFNLDSVKLHLDDTMVSSYLYTQREVTALRKGGVQRLYTGNIKSGPHQLVAVFTGTGPQEKDYKRAETISIEKKKGAAFIKITIRDDADKKQPEFKHETWK